MVRMAQDGYPEGYRRMILKNGIAIYKSKLAAADAGERPLNRPAGYQKLERRKLKKRSWFARGGYAAPVVIPATPGSVLLHRMRAVAELEKDPKLRLRIVERGGVSLVRQLMNPGILQTRNCGDKSCPMYDEAGCGSVCRRSNINYRYSCQLPPYTTPESTDNSCYHGETSRNIFTRGNEHQNAYSKKSDKSFIHTHQTTKHNGEPAKFKVTVLSQHRDPMSRVIQEAMNIKNHQDKGLECLNSKAEYRQAPIVRTKKNVIIGL